ncbi:MAG: hypothetical protein E5V58_18615, partial [Mesorhizobium sp.]
FLRFRCSRTSSALRSGSRKPPFSTRPDPNLGVPRRPDWQDFLSAVNARPARSARQPFLNPAGLSARNFRAAPFCGR